MDRIACVPWLSTPQDAVVGLSHGTVVEQVLPHVELIEPRSSIAVTKGKPISISAEASDRNGKIARLEFWVKTWLPSCPRPSASLL
jgi:hypothetical protein